MVYLGNGKLKKVRVDKTDALVEAPNPCTSSDSSFNPHFISESPGINSVLKENRLVATAEKIQVQNMNTDSDKVFTPEISSNLSPNRICNKPSLSAQIKDFNSDFPTKKASIEDSELKIILVILIVAGTSALLAVLFGNIAGTLAYVLLITSVCAATIAVCMFFRWLFNKLGING